MNRRKWITIAALECAVIATAWTLTALLTVAVSAADQPAKDKPAPDLFGLAKVWQVHLEITAAEWKGIQPKGGPRMFPGRPGQPPAPAAKPGEPAADSHRSAFGVEFPWVHGAITLDGQTFSNVGVRYKGNASYMASSRGLKRNFKIGLEHFDEEQRYHGQKSINLNAGAMDPTKGREALSFAVFRAAGVPASRTAYAQVTLTVPGQHDKELLGLYIVVEQVDKTFLKAHFKNAKGLLLKPERLRGLEYLGDDWERYKERYQPKDEPSKKESQRVIDFVKLVNRGSDEQFGKEIDSYLDVDKFLRFVAVNALLCNLDSFLMVGHNYYIYLNPDTNKFVFLPWDMDLSIAGFPMGGSPDQQADLSLKHPYAGENKLIDRLLAIKDVNDKYQKILQELARTCFAKEQLLQDIDTLEKVVKEPLAREKKAAEARKEGPGGFGFGPPGGGMFGRSMELRTFVDKRTESVAAQLDGRSKGTVPAGMAFGPGGRPGGPGGPPAMGSFLAKPLLEALDGDKDAKVSKEEFVAAVRKFFKVCDPNQKGTIDEKAIAEGLNRILPPPPGFGPPGGPRPAPGGPVGPPAPGFGPGALLAGVIVKRAGADKDGKLTVDQLIAAAETLFRECDKEKSGSLGEKEVAAGIDLIFPAPRVFEFPGRRPPEPKKEDGKP